MLVAAAHRGPKDQFLFKKRYLSKLLLRWLKVAILKLPLPLLLLQTAIMEIRAILKAQTDAAAASSKTCRFL